MAQNRRKRQTKHRGNAAGEVVARGRTGRKLTAEERQGGSGKAAASAKRPDRFDRPPTWKGAAIRGSIAAVALLVLMLALGAKPAQTVGLFVFALALYVPGSYYVDLWAYRRRMRKKERESQRAGK